MNEMKHNVFYQGAWKVLTVFVILKYILYMLYNVTSIDAGYIEVYIIYVI